MTEFLQGRVEDLTHDGSGVVKVNEKVYFVDKVLPEELITFQSGKKRKGKYQGVLEKILEPSTKRVEPECQYFGICGGCALQHFDQTAQIIHKQKILEDAFTRIGRVTLKNRLNSITGSVFHYRRKARLGVKLVPKKGGILVGFRERKSSFITSLQACKTLDKRISDLLPALHQLISQLENNHQIPQLEVAAGDFAVSIVVRHLCPLSEKDKGLLRSFADENKINIFVQSGGLDTVIPLRPENPEDLEFSLDKFDLSLRFSPIDFVQVNADINQKMVEAVIDYLELDQSDQVLDLFCGLGNFTLAISKFAKHTLGIEGNAGLVQRAIENAQLNKIKNVEFQIGNLFEKPNASIVKGRIFNKVLIDPPRSGAIEVVTNLIPLLKPEKIVYVSCNPATLARDASIIVHEQGYELGSAGIINMFPHTAHVESIAIFNKR